MRSSAAMSPQCTRRQGLEVFGYFSRIMCVREFLRAVGIVLRVPPCTPLHRVRLHVKVTMRR